MTYTPPKNTHLSGDVTATTATAGDADTSVATTEFVAAAIIAGTAGSYLPLTGGTLTGNLAVSKSGSSTLSVLSSSSTADFITDGAQARILFNAGGTTFYTLFSNGSTFKLTDNTASINPFLYTNSTKKLDFSANTTVVAPTASVSTNNTNVATTSAVTSALSIYAPLANPALTGTPTAPTATAGTNTTQLATTAFVTAATATGPADMVTTDTTQTITSFKTFNNISLFQGSAAINGPMLISSGIRGGSFTLDATSMVGQRILGTGTIATLPTAASILGSLVNTFWLRCEGLVPITISRSGTDTINYDGSTSLTSITVQPGESVFLVTETSGIWYAYSFGSRRASAETLSGTKKVTGIFTFPYVTKSSAYTATTSDRYITVTGTTTITLPTGAPAGMRLEIKNIDAALITTVARGSTDTIDGATSTTLATNISKTLIYDGAGHWYSF